MLYDVCHIGMYILSVLRLRIHFKTMNDMPKTTTFKMRKLRTEIQAMQKLVIPQNLRH